MGAFSSLMIDVRGAGPTHSGWCYPEQVVLSCVEMELKMIGHGRLFSMVPALASAWAAALTSLNDQLLL